MIKSLSSFLASTPFSRRGAIFFPIFRQDITKDQFLLVLEIRFFGLSLFAPVFARVTLHVLAVFEGLFDVWMDDLKTV